MESNHNFKNIKDYLHHWDLFFEEWVKGESHQKKLLDSDTMWGYHKGKLSKDKKTGKLTSTKLEHDVFPQPYLGDILNHSVISLNLNPSRSKLGEKKITLENGEKGNENDVFEEKHLQAFLKKDNKEVYQEHAKGFPTYDIDFWQDQDGWIDSIFENIFDKKVAEEKLYQYDPETKKKVKLKPFAIEICPWGSKSWLPLDLKKEIKKLKKLDISTIYFFKYLNNFVFDVIEKAIDNSKLKIVLSVGKAYYDIFNHENDFEKLSEFTKSSKTNNEVVAETNPHNEDFITKIKANWPLNKMNLLTNRNFSFWKRNDTLYYNVFSTEGGKNNPPGKNFNKIEKEFFRIYKSLIIK